MMLLKSYSKKISRPECNPGFQSLHCIAHLDQDITDVLPYPNSVPGGFEYFKDPAERERLPSRFIQKAAGATFTRGQRSIQTTVSRMWSIRG